MKKYEKKLSFSYIRSYICLVIPSLTKHLCTHKTSKQLGTDTSFVSSQTVLCILRQMQVIYFVSAVVYRGHHTLPFASCLFSIQVYLIHLSLKSLFFKAAI